MKKLMMFVALLLVGGAAAAPWMVGNHVEKELGRLTELSSQISGPMMSVEVVSFTKGYLTSEATTRMTMQQGSEVVGLEMKHRIQHGPNPSWGLARIETDYSLTGPMGVAVNKAFGGPAVTSVSTVSFAGDWVEEITSAAIEVPLDGAPDTVLAWQGLSGTATVSGSEVHVDINAPGFTVKSPEGEVRLGKMDIKIDGTASENSSGMIGESSMSIDEFVVAGDGVPQVKVGRMAITGRTEAGADGTLASYSDISVAGLKVVEADQEHGFTRLHIATSLTNLNAEAMDRLATVITKTAEAQAVPAMSGATGQPEMMEAVAAVLQNSPVFEMEEFMIETPNGDFDADMRLAFNGENFEWPTPLPLMIGRLDFSLNAETPPAFIREVVRNYVIYQARAKGATQEEAEASVPTQMIDQQLEALVVQGMLVKTDSSFKLSFSFKDGAVLLNGQPADGLLGSLMGAAMGGGA